MTEIEQPRPSPLEDLKSVCRQIFDRWDKDQRSGKLLTALEGLLPGYDPRVDRIHQALIEHQQEQS